MRTGVMKQQPWYKRYHNAKSRCKTRKSYLAKGIKMKLSFWEMGTLWYRDKAAEMIEPTIDRIDNDGDYKFDNCRFIEAWLNKSLAHKGRTVPQEVRNRISNSMLHNTNKRKLR